MALLVGNFALGFGPGMDYT